MAGERYRGNHMKARHMDVDKGTKTVFPTDVEIALIYFIGAVFFADARYTLNGTIWAEIYGTPHLGAVPLHSPKQ